MSAFSEVHLRNLSDVLYADFLDPYAAKPVPLFGPSIRLETIWMRYHLAPTFDALIGLNDATTAAVVHIAGNLHLAVIAKAAGSMVILGLDKPPKAADKHIVVSQSIIDSEAFIKTLRPSCVFHYERYGYADEWRRIDDVVDMDLGRHASSK